MKNRLITFFCWFFQKKPPPCLQRFLIVSTTGLGDSLWAVPAIDGLKKTYPKIKIDLLTSAVGEKALRNNPAIDKVYTIKEPLFWSFFSLRKQLKMRYSHALIFHSSQRLILPLLIASYIPNRVGTKGQQKGLDHLLTVALTDKTHEITRREHLLSALDAKILDPKLRFFLTEEEKIEGEKWIQPYRKNAPLILVHAGAKDLYKCWPEKRFIELIKKLQQTLSCTIFLGYGQPKEKAAVTAIQKKTPGSILIEPKNLRLYAGILNHVDLVITNDTGPMHLASSLDTNVLAFFSATDPLRSGPYRENTAHILHQPRACTPCLARSCKRPFCMEQISVEKALEKTLEILHYPK